MEKSHELWGDKHLRIWRAEHKLSVAQACFYLDVSPDTLRRWSNGAYPRDLRERMVAAEAKRTGQAAPAPGNTAQGARYPGRPKSPERVVEEKQRKLFHWSIERRADYERVVYAAEVLWRAAEAKREQDVAAAKKRWDAAVSVYNREHPMVDLPPPTGALYYELKGLPVPDVLPPEPEPPHGHGHRPTDDYLPFRPFIRPEPPVDDWRAEALERFGVYLTLTDEPDSPLLRTNRKEGKFFKLEIDWSRSTEKNPDAT